MKFLKLIFAILLSAGLLIGCGTDDVETNNDKTTGQNETENLEIEVIVSLENGEEVLEQEELEAESGSLLLDIMKENFDVEDDNGLITTINGITNEEGETNAWFYTVNGEHAMVGAAEYEVEDGDLIEFDFHSWE